MGIAAYDPKEAAKGPTNAKRGAVVRMLTQHGFDVMPNAGDVQHQLYQHREYRDITVKVVGHNGSGDLKIATTANCGRACLKVLERQKEKRDHLSKAALKSLSEQDAATAHTIARLVKDDTVTIEQRPDRSFLLRDANYPELGISLRPKSSPER